MKNTLDTTNIGDRIRQLRKNLSLNQYEFAQALGIKQPSLSQVEKGVISPSVRLLQRLTQKFNVTYEWLLDNQGSMQRQLSPETLMGEQAGAKRLFPARIVERSQYATYATQCNQAEFTNALPLMLLPNLDGDNMRIFEVPNDFLAPNLMDGDLVVCSPLAHASHIMSGQTYVMAGASGVSFHRVVSNLYWQQALLVADPLNPAKTSRLSIASDSIAEIWHVFARFTMRLDAPRAVNAFVEAANAAAPLFMQQQTNLGAAREQAFA